MKTQMTIIFLLFNSLTYSQVLDLQPTVGATLDFSPEAIARFNSPEAYKKCGEVYQKMNAENRDPTTAEKEILKYCDETKEDIWKTEGGGCSWYCGMGPKNIEASSSLSSQGVNSYEAKNAHDFSYKSAWVEGVSGYGIGEHLLYTFRPENPRITTIKVVNGYVKSKSSWINNSRVKKFKMYVDNKLFAYLNLKDIRAEQSFEIPAIGNNERSNYELMQKQNSWTVKFEIAEVYKGAKYDDVVISEIFFDGLDVHCFAAGTKIHLSNGTERNIESLEIGQEVLSLNTSTGKFETSRIVELASPIHHNLVKLTFNDGRTLEATDDHPFFNGQKWFSYNPTKTKRDYDFDNVSQLEIGSKLQTIDQLLEIVSIKRISEPQITYTIVKLERNNTFIANGIVVGTEPLRLKKKLPN